MRATRYGRVAQGDIAVSEGRAWLLLARMRRHAPFCLAFSATPASGAGKLQNTGYLDETRHRVWELMAIQTRYRPIGGSCSGDSDLARRLLCGRCKIPFPSSTPSLLLRGTLTCFHRVSAAHSVPVLVMPRVFVARSELSMVLSLRNSRWLRGRCLFCFVWAGGKDRPSWQPDRAGTNNARRSHSSGSTAT